MLLDKKDITNTEKKISFHSKKYLSDFSILEQYLEQLKERRKKMGNIFSKNYNKNIYEVSIKKINILKFLKKDKKIMKLEREYKYFFRIKNELLQNKKYLDKYVAINNQEIIDCDENQIKLAKRVYKKYPGETILLEKVSDIEDIEIIETPFLENEK